METIEQTVKKCERHSVSNKSFFVKRLEQHLLEKSIKIPSRIFTLFDTPFERFNQEYADLYEQKIKGQALFYIFSDMLVEIYEDIGADKTGWESAANFLEDTPMKVCALHALKRIDELEESQKEEYLYMVEQFNGLSTTHVTPVEEKLDVKPYSGKDKSRWWKKEDLRLVGARRN